ncbi:hypothetical protein ABW19_dt0202442 [Dactylella cylindrospora]|nr:hypothetical protein ABW19_dt0202442 [Dactylella cylindrospora]
MSVFQRPPKRVRSSSGSKPLLYDPNQTVPILLRHEPEKAIIRCLEAVANERLLRHSDLIDNIVKEYFLPTSHQEAHNNNLTNIKEAKQFLARRIGPILYSIITPYIDQYIDTQEKSTEDAANTAIPEVAPAASSTQDMPPAPTAINTETPFTGPSDGAPAIKTWMEQDPAYPLFRGVGPGAIGPSPISTTSALPDQWRSVRGVAFSGVSGTKSEAAVGEDPPSNSVSPVRTRPPPRPARSVSGNTIDRLDTRSIVSTTRSKGRSTTNRACTFCAKELPSPSARREHEAVHIETLIQYKQYQCKQCDYRSTRPREVWHHMKNRHGWEVKGRKVTVDQDLIDHGPLSEDRMAQLRRDYHAEKQDNLNLTPASFFATPNPKAPDRDNKTERDELASQHNTLISMDYSYTAPIHTHQQPQVSSSVNNMFGTGSHFDETNSYIMRDAMDQTSQIDFPLQDFSGIRNSIGFAQSFLPSGPQLIGVGAAHANSLIDIPSTLDVEDDAQGENESWETGHLFNTMKGE